MRSSDNLTLSEKSILKILINGKYVTDIGFLLDTSNDGIYDKFYSNLTKIQTDTENLNGENLLIDDNTDGKWDYIYDVKTGHLSSYVEDNLSGNENSIFFILIIGLVPAIILIVVVSIFLRRRNKKER